MANANVKMPIDATGPSFLEEEDLGVYMLITDHVTIIYTSTLWTQASYILS